MLEVIDIRDEADFDRRVLEGAEDRVFVIDFWADWCAPCRALAPILERALEDYGDRATLVKINVDQQPALSADFGVQSIPAVKALQGGQIIGEFVGAQPEAAVRKFLGEWIAAPADDPLSQARRQAEAGDARGAEALLRETLAAEPGQPEARVQLATLLLDRGEIDEAIELVSTIGLGEAQCDAAQALRGRAEFLRICRASAGRSALALTVAEREDDLDARYALACCMAAEGDHEMALQHFLEVFRRNRQFRDQSARKAMLTIFSILGADHPLVGEYRKRLSRLLFS